MTYGDDLRTEKIKIFIMAVDPKHVSLKIILCFFLLFLCLMIFQTPLFSDEVGPYAEFQRSLIN